MFDMFGVQLVEDGRYPDYDNDWWLWLAYQAETNATRARGADFASQMLAYPDLTSNQCLRRPILLAVLPILSGKNGAAFDHLLYNARLFQACTPCGGSNV